MKFRPYRVAYSEKASNSIREECNYNNHQLYYLSHDAQNGNNENSANYIHRNNGNDSPRIIDPSNCSKRDHISHEDSVNDFSEFVIRKGSGGMCIEKKVPRQSIAYRTDSHQHDIFLFPNQNKKTNDISEEEIIKGALFAKTLNYLYRYNNSSNDSSAISGTLSIKKEEEQEKYHWRYQISQSLVQPSVFLSHNTFAHAFWDDDSNLQKQKDSQQSTEISNSKSNQNLGYNKNEFGFIIDLKVMKKRKLNNNNKNEESSLIHSDSYSVALELANPNNRQKKRKNVLEEEPNHKNKDDDVEESVISITPNSTFPHHQDREASTKLFVFSTSAIEPFFIRNEQDWIAILSQQEQAQDTVVDVIGTSSSACAIGSKKWFVKRKTQWRLHRALRRISNSNEGTHHHNQLDGCTDIIPLLQIDPKIPPLLLDGHNNDVRVQQNTDNQDEATLSSFPTTTTSMDIMSHLQFTRKNNSRSSEISIAAPSRQTQKSQTLTSWILNHHAPVNELFTTSIIGNSQDAGIGLKTLLEEHKQYLYDPAKKNPFTSDDQVDSNSTSITSNETSTTTYSPSYIRTNQDIPILSEEKEKACHSSFVFSNTEETRASQKILHQLRQQQQQKQHQHDEYEYPHHRIQTQTRTCTTKSQQTQFDLMISKRHILNTKMFKSTLLTLGSNSNSNQDVKFSPRFIPHLVKKKSLATKVIRHGGSDGVEEESKKKKQKETLEMKSLVRKIVNTTNNDSSEEIEESHLQMLNQVEKRSSGYPIKQAAITTNTASNLSSPSEKNKGSKLSTTFIGKGKLKMKISSISHQIIQQQKESMNASKKLHDFWNLLLTGCQAQRKKNVNRNSSGLSFVYQGFLSGQYVNSIIYERRYRNMIHVLKNEQELKLENRRLMTITTVKHNDNNDDNAVASQSSSSAVDMALGYLQMYSHLSRIPFLLLNNTTTTIEKNGSKKKRANTNKIIKNNNASLSLFCKSNKRRRLEQEENSIPCNALHVNCDKGKDSKGNNIDEVRDDVRVDSFEEYCHKVSILNTLRRNKLALDNSTTASSPSSSPNKEDHSILFWDHLGNQMERISEHSVLLRAELNHLLLKAFEISRKEKKHGEEEDYHQCDIMELNEVLQGENDNDVEITQVKKVPRTSDDIIDNKNSTRQKRRKKKKSKKKKKRKHKKERKEEEEEEEERHQSKKKKMQYNHSDSVKQDSSYDFTDNHDEPVERKLDFTNEEKEEPTTCSSTQHPTPTGARAVVVQDSLKYIVSTEDTVRKQLEFDKPHNSQSHQQDQLHLQCYDEGDKENMLPILENNNHRQNHHNNYSSFSDNSHDKMTNNNAAKMPFTSHNVIAVKTNQGQHNHPPQPFEDFDTIITILCSESFLEMTTSSKSISELATGQWANNFISQSRNSHSMDFTTQIQTPPTKGRKIKLLDCPLIDECLVDLELPDNRSAIIVIPLSTWDISDDVPGTSKGKEFIRKLVQLLSMGRYSKIYVFFCIDNNNNDSSVHNAVKDEISMVQSAFSLQDGCHFCDSLNFQYVSQINLSLCIAERVLEAYNNNRNESESEIINNSNNILLENFAHDLNIQEKARFLIQIAPSLNVSGVLKRMICYSQRYSKEGKSSADPNISQFNFQRFLKDFLVVEKEKMISKDSQKENSMWWQLSLALNAMLVNE